jgi:hypothetical protein
MICLKALDVDGMDSLCRLGLSVKPKAVIQMKKKKNENNNSGGKLTTLYSSRGIQSRKICIIITKKKSLPKLMSM